MKRRFEELVCKRGLENNIVIDDGGCYGRCKIGPNIFIFGPISELQWDTIRVPGVKMDDSIPFQIYTGVSPNDCAELLEEHCLHGRVVSRLAEAVQK